MRASRAFVGVVLVVLGIGLPVADVLDGPGAVRMVPMVAAFVGLIGVHRRIEGRSRVVLASVGSVALLFLPLALAPWAVLTGPLLLLAAAVLPTTAGAPRGADLAALVPLTALFAAVVCGGAALLA